MKASPHKRVYPLTHGCLAVLLGVTLAGCASVPDLGQVPELQTTAQLPSQHSLATSTVPASAEQPWAAPQWWLHYHDEQLNKLMDQALTNAPDLQTARARILKAAGYAQQAGASLLPGVNLDTSVTRVKQSYNNGVPEAAIPQDFNTASRAALDFSYELDFWGKNRAAVAAATSELAAAQAEAAQTRLILTTAIASAYAELARLHADYDAAVQAVTVRQHSVTLLQSRQRNGLETMGSVRQAESRLAEARADRLAAEEAIALQRYRLTALAGIGPDAALSITRPTVELIQPQAVPSTLAADLIGHRPDLVAARQRVEAAAKGIDVARAGFMPNVNLTAYVGMQSLGTLDLLTQGGSEIAGIGPAISLPIFRGGQLQGAYRVARAEYDNAVASYNQTLLQALHEVVTSVTQQHLLTPQLQERQTALQTAEQAYQLTDARYEGGLASYLAVLSAEDSVIATRRALADLQSQSFTLDVALIKALGGGYQRAVPTATQPASHP
ncbi:efflux transporter outer membrane subunit [Pokkaliibacter sp. MBI-7]|uniref:efflux transporter outer membrane subunit n=1 Tax=Pokkaliibacter sp. MBI-7 TaxID=3040600 RepID=UPI00244D0C5B|nr:efflux transporter outer membrane subunit [Pokkaliibacter sp. MBI-7]MDH2431781.1 efflux transporter outer membrane subunit [Pokkaliibacter sp. MBI-7]